MQSFKTGHRSDVRHRPHRPSPDQQYQKNHNELTQASTLGAIEGATRIANLKLLLAKVKGDVAMLSAAAQLKLPGLQQMLDGQSVVGNEIATHIEFTLGLGQGWLDRKHEMSDISAKTEDILLGKDISDFEEEIRRSEQKGFGIMKTGTGTASTSAAPSGPLEKPTTSAEKTGSSSDKPANELVEVRKANLTLLTRSRGAKSRLARVLQVSESIISFLFNGKKDFSNRFSRDLEKALHLSPKWLDSPHSEKDVPQKAWDILGGATKSANQSLNLSSKSVDIPGLKFNLTTEPTELERSVSSSKETHAQAKSQPQSAPAAASTTHQEGAKDKAQGTTPARAPKVHRVEKTKPAPQPSLTLQLNTTAAPSELFASSKQAEVLPELDDETPSETALLGDASVGESLAQPEASEKASEAEKVASSGPVVTSRPARRQVVPPKEPVAPAASAPVTPEPAAAPLAEVPAAAASAAPAPAPAPKPSAPAQAPALAAAPAIARASAPATVILGAAPTAFGTHGDESAINPAVEARADVFILSPITEALIKTLTLKAREGLLSDKDAYQLLGQISGL